MKHVFLALAVVVMSVAAQANSAVVGSWSYANATCKTSAGDKAVPYRVMFNVNLMDNGSFEASGQYLLFSCSGRGSYTYKNNVIDYVIESTQGNACDKVGNFMEGKFQSAVAGNSMTINYTGEYADRLCKEAGAKLKVVLNKR